jgi:hypothetical protein
MSRTNPPRRPVTDHDRDVRFTARWFALRRVFRIRPAVIVDLREIELEPDRLRFLNRARREVERG